MIYNYFANENFKRFREALLYQNLGNYIYLSAYKHQRFFAHKFLLIILKKILPSLYIEKDLSEINPQKIKEIIRKTSPFYLSGFSFQEVSNDLNFRQKKRGTFIINLEKSLNEVWSSLDYSLRKQLRKAKRLKLRIKKVENLNELKRYYGLLKSCRKSLGFRMHSFRILKKQWESLHKNDPQNSCFEVFLCLNKDDELLSGMGIVISPIEKCFIEVAAARSEYSKIHKLPDNDFLKWSIIQWAHRNGRKYYDLAGVSPNPLPGSKEEGIYCYKKKWGGKFYDFYYYEKYFLENRWYYPTFYYLLKRLNLIKKNG